MDRAESRFLESLHKRLEELKTAMAEHPAADYVGYRVMVAKYEEVKETIEKARKAFSGADDEEDRPYP